MFEKLCTTSVIRDAGEEGVVTPLIIDAALTGGLGLMNPSILRMATIGLSMFVMFPILYIIVTLNT